MVNWSRYLESLCNAYAQWWQVYTITDVVGRKRVELEPSALLFDFGLMVQTVERGEERGRGEKKVERLSVLEGLRKYASEHVLLVGRPGSGKSTALARLLLEEAEKARTPLNPPLLRGEEDLATQSGANREASGRSPLNPPLERGEEDSDSLAPPLASRSFSEDEEAGGVKIPVLVELRYYRTSVLDLIQDFLQRHDPNLTVDAETLKSWLRHGQLLLLVDGLNELPSEEARRDLHKLRQDYQKTTPMIFTTRDLGVGGDLDIDKKLEMQPLTKAQMQQFVRAYLQKQGEQMLRHLGSRLREFGQTPLLLWMLCSLFKAMGKVPPNLGLVFRQFAQSYEGKLKQDIPTSRESRRWWQRLLQHLAWVMTTGEAPTELQVAIPRQQAETVLTEFLRDQVDYPEDCALSWLEDLLKYHLIQLGAGDQIEFRHQLIQEYYTAERLLKLLPSLTDDELKREYLNYLKWTEPLALMLELMNDKAQAVRVVKLALEVDWWLGANLAGTVKPEWQEQTVGQVAGLEISQLIKFQLLDITKSERVIPHLIKALEDEDSSVRWQAAKVLGNLGSEAAIPHLIKALQHEDSYVRWQAAEVLGNLGSKAAIFHLIKALKDEDSSVRWHAAKALGNLGSKAAILHLIKALEDEDSSVRWQAAEVLGNLGSEAAIPHLIKALEDEGSSVRWQAAKALGNLGSEAAVTSLIKALEHEDFSVRRNASEVLGNLGSEAAVTSLIKALEHEDSSVRSRAAQALGNLSSEVAIPQLIKALEHENYYFRWQATKALGNLGSEAAVTSLIKALEDEDSSVRSRAAQALGNLGSEAAIPYLIKALEDEDSSVRRKAA